MAHSLPSAANTMATQIYMSSPLPVACLAVSRTILVTTSSLAGRPMASRSSSPHVATALPTAVNSTPSRSMAPFPLRCPSLWPKMASFLPMPPTLPIHPSSIGKRPGSVTTAVKLSKSGWPIYLIRASSKSLVKIPMTSIPCGSATKSTSSPIAKAPPLSSPMTWLLSRLLN